MKAFVTGATGFIGRRLVEKLKNDGVEVIALVRTASVQLPEGVHVVRGDILQPDSFRNAGKGCGRVYHLAALITFDPRRRGDLLQVNGNGTVNVLACANDWGVESSVVVSSACTIGLSQSREHVLDEDAPLSQTLVRSNPYLESKLCAERAALDCSDCRVVIVNPTTVYGSGDWTLNSGTLIKQVARSPVLPLPPGGSNVVDVDDVVNGIIAAGEHGRSGYRYILGGENLTFKQIFAIIARAVKHQPVFVPLPAYLRPPMAAAAWLAGRLIGNRFLTPQIVGDLFAYRFYSSARAARELGWSTRYSFEESVKRAWDFYQREKLV